jgi:hypothetical protein
MDAELVKAPVPIERLAARMRRVRFHVRAIQGDPAGCDRAALAAARDDYRSLLTAAALLEVPTPPGGVGDDEAAWGEVENALGRAGLHLGERRA